DRSSGKLGDVMRLSRDSIRTLGCSFQSLQFHCNNLFTTPARVTAANVLPSRENAALSRSTFPRRVSLGTQVIASSNSMDLARPWAFPTTRQRPSGEKEITPVLARSRVLEVATSMRL